MATSVRPLLDACENLYKRTKGALLFERSQQNHSKLTGTCRLQDTAVIVSYFNPLAFDSKRENLATCIWSLNLQGIRPIIGEAVYGEQPADFESGEVCDVIHFKTDSILFQKENIFNLIVEKLPNEIEYVVLLDGDVILDSPDWLRETRQKLADFHFVQPFAEVIRLPKHVTSVDISSLPSGNQELHRYNSLSKSLCDQDEHWINRKFKVGTMGYAWATSKHFLQRFPLYDLDPLGNGDLINVLTWLGLPLDDFLVQMPTGARNAIRNWMSRMPTLDRDKRLLSFVPQHAFHLWHGSIADRAYVSRNSILESTKFDPANDMIREDGVVKISPHSAKLAQLIEEHFQSKNEDQEYRTKSASKLRLKNIIYQASLRYL